MENRKAKYSAERYLELSRSEASRSVEKIIGEFDFKKAAGALSGCEWKYMGADSSPTADELQTIAREIIQEAINHGSGVTVAKGPLEAQVMHYDVPEVVSVRLRLVPVSSSAVHVDFRVLCVKKERNLSKKRATTPAK